APDPARGAALRRSELAGRDLSNRGHLIPPARCAAFARRPDARRTALEHAMRGALTPSRSIRRSARPFAMYARLGKRLAPAAPNPTALVPLALQSISGHTSLFNMLATGGRLVVTDGFHPHRTLELVERERVTNLGGTPMMFELLLRVKRDYDLSSLLLVISG